MPARYSVLTNVDGEGRIPREVSIEVAEVLQLYRGGEVHIAVGPRPRSTKANAYYWGVVIEEIRKAAIQSGQVVSADVLHQIFKHRYLPARPVECFGEEYTLGPSTTELTSTEFFDYIEQIRMDDDVMAMGVHIPDPEGSFQSYAVKDMT